MIKIQNSNLEQIANEHYNLLCNIFNFSISKRLDASLAKYKIKRKDIYKKYVKLLQYLQDNLEDIIIGKPQKLEYHKIKLIELSKDFEFTKKDNKKTSEQKEILADLNKIFNYETFSSKGFKKDIKRENGKSEKLFYSGNVLVEKLGIWVCPYCNRNTIYNIKYGEQRTSELDHFYPKSKYPYFALSFYNLIPSCKVCNKIKLDNDDKKYINPYDDRFDMSKSVKFSLKIKSSNFYHLENGFNIEYKFSDKISKDERDRIENNLEDFALKDLYQNHKDIILELIQKEVVYNDSYLDELFKSYEGTLFKNREDLQRLISGGFIDESEINKRPLSKLIKDISQELGLW